MVQGAHEANDAPDHLLPEDARKVRLKRCPGGVRAHTAAVCSGQSSARTVAKLSGSHWESKTSTKGP